MDFFFGREVGVGWQNLGLKFDSSFAQIISSKYLHTNWGGFGSFFCGEGTRLKGGIEDNLIIRKYRRLTYYIVHCIVNI